MTRRTLVVCRPGSVSIRRPVRGFTLVEMLIAMAITLVMIGAVVTLFANISNSVRNRRAVIELSGQMRHARNMLQQDLQGATCNGLVWQRPEENQGYIEIIEGLQREGQASVLINGAENTNVGPQYDPEIDHKTSIIPASNVPFSDTSWLTDGGSLGDGDDILMLTVRNEHEPFVGRVPNTDGLPVTNRVRPNLSDSKPFAQWQPTTITSPLAEVVWFAVENPDQDTNDAANGFFGEPGMRTIYRRTFLIAPWINPYRFVNPNNGEIDDTFQLDSGGPTFTAQPGLVRILQDNVDRDDPERAIASLIAFQELYDLSVRLEWDPLLGGDGRWKIVANTLGDLTKRENRYAHIGYGYDGTTSDFSRNYPYPVVSQGVNHSSATVSFATDAELPAFTPPPPEIRAMISTNDNVFDYEVREGGTGFVVPPFLYFAQDIPYQATARAILNDEGEIVRVIHGPVPLSRERRGEDVMLSDALAFDLRVYDPGAPLFAHRITETVLEPTDPAWLDAYMHNDNRNGDVSDIGGNNAAVAGAFPFIGQGAYVDLGYGYNRLATRRLGYSKDYLPPPKFANAFSSSTTPWFFPLRMLNDVTRYDNPLAPGYAVFDTWSFHYENNGLNEDRDEIEGTAWQFEDYDGNGTPQVDEGTNGLDDPGHYVNNSVDPPTIVTELRLGADDAGERETVPPYDKPLRGLQAVLRLYERDSRQVRQVSVNQSFVPE